MNIQLLVSILPDIEIRTNDLVGKFVFIDLIGKIIIDFAGFSVFNNMEGEILYDLEGKYENLKNFY